MISSGDMFRTLSEKEAVERTERGTLGLQSTSTSQLQRGAGCENGEQAVRTGSRLLRASWRVLPELRSNGQKPVMCQPGRRGLR